LKEDGIGLKARGVRGQILIFIVLILIFAVVVFALLSPNFGGRKSAPAVLEAFWRVDGQRVNSASVGDSVEAVVTVRASEQYVGSVILKVRKDVSWWFDKDYSVATVPLDLRGGAERDLTLEFVPDEATVGRVGSLKGYFIEVEFSAVGASWTMDSAYPPRLEVAK
jgi:hypothetical protein